jgi:diguanylate cyclase (GGDEF)-like protein
MSFRRRLTLFFIFIVVVPLAAAGVVVQRVVVDEIERRAVLPLRPALRVAATFYHDRVDSIEQEITGALPMAKVGRLLEQARGMALDRLLARKLDSQGLDFLVAVDQRGGLVGLAEKRPMFIMGVHAATPPEIVATPGRIGEAFAKSRPIAVHGPHGRAGKLIGGFWIDKDALVGSTRNRVELAVVANDRTLASSRPLSRPVPVSIPSRGEFDVDIAGRGRAVARPLGRETTLVAWAPKSSLRALASRFLDSLVALLVIAVLATTVLAYLLAQLITRPLTELAEGAQAIAEGRFDRRVSTRSKGEVGELAEAFNDMSERLNETITALSTSRRQLERAVQRAGETLRSTHDMDQILESILNTAADAVAAQAAILWRFSPTRDELYPALSRGLDKSSLRNVALGAGVAGLVADRGTPLLRGPDDEPLARSGEPIFPATLAAPFHTQGRVQGVIALYRADSAGPFRREDLDTVAFLAEQGGVAIENVALHEEAQRLSLTDGLTSVWNRRYFQMQFRQVLATAVRFQRPFSLLMMDLDRFKAVNDTFGHQRGDAVLVEFAKRVSHVLREVDTFARYGGEEFIALLPETDFSGAMTTAGKVVDVIGSEPFGDPGETPIRLTVSVGVASYPHHATSLTGLIQAADGALYRAKQEGRDRVVVAGEQPPNLTIVG